MILPSNNEVLVTSLWEIIILLGDDKSCLVIEKLAVGNCETILPSA